MLILCSFDFYNRVLSSNIGMLWSIFAAEHYIVCYSLAMLKGCLGHRLVPGMKQENFIIPI